MGKRKDSFSYIRYYCPCGETILISATVYYRLSDDELAKYLDDHCPKYIVSQHHFMKGFMGKTNHIEPSVIDEMITGLDDSFFHNTDDNSDYD